MHYSMTAVWISYLVVSPNREVPRGTLCLPVCLPACGCSCAIDPNKRHGMRNMTKWALKLVEILEACDQGMTYHVQNSTMGEVGEVLVMLLECTSWQMH